jgi:predicted glycoside hydrolase/deacetylase ChbG (UPF0249 family)
MTVPSQGAYLIVNADDYGYFNCVSRGILKCASRGTVTATGVFGNSVHFREHSAWLRDCDSLDIGVHLNLTSGEPLTSDMRKKLSRWSGKFPGKFSGVMAVLSGAIAAADVRLEWRAQIERCLESGMLVQFLNSHEHMHILPSLFRVVCDLAREYGIAHVRFPNAEFYPIDSLGSLFRVAVVQAFAKINRRNIPMPTADFIGLETSGRLDQTFIQRRVSTLKPGRVYELMCHPGYLDKHEIGDPRLSRYHDWEGELEALTNPAFKQSLDTGGIQLIGYRHLAMADGELVVRR